MGKHVVVAVVNYRGKILLGKKRSDSHKVLAGEWHIPGEGVEGTESDEEALIRGIKEEAGLEIKVGKYLGSTVSPTSKKEVRWYECFSSTDKIIYGSDLENAMFVDKKQVLDLCKKANSFWSDQIVNYFK